MNDSFEAEANKTGRQLRDMTEAGVEQSKEFLKKGRAATNEAASVMQDSFSRAMKGMQAYNSKVLEFARANTESNITFIQSLAGMKTPSEFFELSTGYAKRQLEVLAQQGAELTALTQQMTLSAAQPIKTELTKHNPIA